MARGVFYGCEGLMTSETRLSAQYEAQYRSIFESALDGILLIDEQGRVVEANPACERIFGERPEALAGRLMQELIHFSKGRPKTADTTWEAVRMVGRRGEMTATDAAGREFPVDVTIRPFTVDERDFYTVTLRDLSSHLLYEKKVTRRDRMLRAVAEATRILLIEANFKRAIESALQMVGEAARVDRAYIFENRAEPKGRRHQVECSFQWVAPTRRGRVEAAPGPVTSPKHFSGFWWQDLAKGKPVAGLAPDFPETDRRFLEQFGMYSVLIVPIMIQNQFWGAVGFDDRSRERFWTDGEISTLEILAGSLGGAIQRQQTEDQLSMANQELMLANINLFQEATRLELILKCIGDGVIVSDLEHQVLIINNVARAMLGIEGEGNPPLRELFADCEPKGTKVLKVVAATPAQGSSDFELKCKREGGRTYKVTTTKYLDESGDASGHVLILHDITRQREIDRMKTAFVSAVSHELRTPLTSIKGFTSTLLNDKQMDEKTRRRFLKIIGTEADRLSQLIEEVLEISRIESGRVQLAVGPRLILPILEESLETLGPSLAGKRIDFIQEHSEKKLVARVDETALQRVIVNLLGNAMKFTPEGGTIWLRTRRGEGRITIEVEDTGLGIPPTDLPHIFERFYRVHRPNMEIAGTGLGLSIVKDLITRMHGEIEVDSRFGNGTKFSIHLPIEEVTQAGEPGR